MGLIDPLTADLAQRLHSGDPTAIDEIRDAFEKTRTVTHAAAELGISVRCLQRWLRRYPRLTRNIAMQGGGWPLGVPRGPKRKTAEKTSA